MGKEILDFNNININFKGFKRPLNFNYFAINIIIIKLKIYCIIKTFY